MTANPPPASRSGGVVATLALAGIVAAIMQTLVTPLIAELPTILDTSAANASWVITATLLAGAVFGPVGGRLGDLYGKRRMLLVCSCPLIVGSVVCALSSTVVPMIVGRGLQGIGMGMVPLGISLLRDVLAAGEAQRLHRPGQRLHGHRRRPRPADRRRGRRVRRAGGCCSGAPRAWPSRSPR